ncbi:MAG: hypothetical protein K0R10_2415 [Alphaproteobacteria bacterium]|jgi:hypothetical protein|nr:hypothetical protein [Alphaproteobacteria bacterium]
MFTGQHGYGLPQSRLSAATAAGRFLAENSLNKDKQKKPSIVDEFWEDEDPRGPLN